MQQRAGHGLDLGHVAGVDADGLDAERLEAGGHAPGQLKVRRRRLGDVVVLHREQQWRTPERRHVDCLVHDALTERAVAEEHDRDGPAVLGVLRQRHSGRERHRAAEHPARVEALPMQVLRAAQAAATPVRRQPISWASSSRWASAVGEKVSVAAVVRHDDVTVAETRENPATVPS